MSAMIRLAMGQFGADRRRRDDEDDDDRAIESWPRMGFARVKSYEYRQKFGMNKATLQLLHSRNV